MSKNIEFMRWAKELFPFNRSITGEGVRRTFNYIKKNINTNFKVKKVNSNKKFYDWKIPKEWKIKNAFIAEDNGKKICDFKENNLHLIGYSQKINKVLNYEDLKKKIYFLKNKPNSIPYLTTYYKKNWGFCMRYKDFKKINKKKKYKVFIDSHFFNGKMNYAELIKKGKSKKEILIVSYICHPSMANNELSGPLVLSALSKVLKPSKYTVRLLLIPETIGAIAYIKLNYLHLKKNLVAGFNLTCLGDKGDFTIISSKEENTYSDKIADRVLKKSKFKKLSFLKRGSNERQFGCQNLGLPFVTICRTRFKDFKEYHTSDDNLKIISEKSLRGSLKKITEIVDEIQNNKIYEKRIFCEPFFTKHGLMRGTRNKFSEFENKISNISAYADRNYDLYDLSKKLKISLKETEKLCILLEKKNILYEFK